MMERKPGRGLGRGLSALMADINISPIEADGVTPAGKRAEVLPVDRLRPNPNQPRRSFAEGDLGDLAASIRAKGVLQPLIVRPLANGDGFEIVAGERRWRAAQMANVHEVPVVIRDFDDTEVLEVAIIENIQRADLNAIEEALGYRQLMDRFGHTQEKLAEALSKSRSHIANLLRLLTLPGEVQELVVAGKLSAGHARALITSPDATRLAAQVVERGLSVRETEELVKRPLGSGGGSGGNGKRGGGGEKDPDTRALEGDLAANLRMAVSIHHEPGSERGTLSIRYNTLDDLDFLCQALSLAQRGML